ncbi:hypothetical protein GC176_17695 [bacterium]|nr:hypothetical protein [bacterium]
MRSVLLLLAALVPVSPAVFAQDEVTRHGGVPDAKLQSYVVQLTEFRLNESADPTMKPQDIVKTFEKLTKDGKVDVIETVRLSALENYPSMAQFGRTAAVTTGVSISQRGRVPLKQQRQIGTLVQFTATPHNEKVLLKLQYEASRFDGAINDESSPDTLTTHFETTLLIAPGVPSLVGATTAGTTSVLLVSITEL